MTKWGLDVATLTLEIYKVIRKVIYPINIQFTRVKENGRSGGHWSLQFWNPLDKNHEVYPGCGGHYFLNTFHSPPRPLASFYIMLFDILM